MKQWKVMDKNSNAPPSFGMLYIWWCIFFYAIIHHRGEYINYEFALLQTTLVIFKSSGTSNIQYLCRIRMEGILIRVVSLYLYFARCGRKSGYRHEIGVTFSVSRDVSFHLNRIFIHKSPHRTWRVQETPHNHTFCYLKQYVFRIRTVS